MCSGSVEWQSKPEILVSTRCSHDVTQNGGSKLVFGKCFSIGWQLLPSTDRGMADSSQCKVFSMTLVESSALGQGKVYLSLPGITITNISGKKKGQEPLCNSRTFFLLIEYVHQRDSKQNFE